MVECLVNNSRKNFKEVVAYLRRYSGTCLERQKKATKHVKMFGA